ncbi:MAG: hypothetical protein R3C68_06435 [Myxococcota bacterium]
MIALLLGVLVFNAPAEVTPGAEEIVGKISVRGTRLAQSVTLSRQDGAPDITDVLELKGDMVVELAQLQSATVAVTGLAEGKTFVVKAYRIVDLGKGVVPWVGELTQQATGGLAIMDGQGEPIVLSLPPRSSRRLRQSVGAKLWVHGRKLLSGELKVLRYGILRAAIGKPAERLTPDTSGVED